MELWGEILAAHESLSPVGRRFLEHVQANPTAIQPIDRQAVPLWVSRLTYPLQSWPVFVGADKLDRIRRAAVEVPRLVKTVFARIFEHDAKRIARFYGLGHEFLATLMLSPPNGLDGALVRGDFVDSAAGFKCLEVNATNVGGWQVGFYEELCRKDPGLRRFLEEQAIQPTHHDTVRTLFSHLLAENAAAPRCDRGVCNIAIVVPGWSTKADQSGHDLDERYARVRGELGLGVAGRVVVCSQFDGFVARGGTLYHGAIPIHAVVQKTSVMTPEHVFRCFKAEAIGLYNGPLGRLLGDKRNLALLSEHEDSDCFDAAERSIIREHVPWSREVADRKTTFRGEAVSLLEFLVAHRESMVLKPGGGSSGDGIAIGKYTEQGAWKALVEKVALQGGWIAQEHLESLPYLFQHEGAGVAHDVVWGLYCFGPSYAGGFLRALPRGIGQGIVNAARGATEAIIFEV